MAFSKAETKRFNEVISCAPPPGYYNPQIKTRQSGIYLERTERFRDDVIEGAENFMVLPSTLLPKKCSSQIVQFRNRRKKFLTCRSLTDVTEKGKRNSAIVWNDSSSASSISEDNFNTETDVLKSQLCAVETELEAQKEISSDLIKKLNIYEELFATHKLECTSWNDFQLPSSSFECVMNNQADLSCLWEEKVVDCGTNHNRGSYKERETEHITPEIIGNVLKILNENTDILNAPNLSLSLLLSVLFNFVQMYENILAKNRESALKLPDCFFELNKIVSFVAEKCFLLVSENEILDSAFKNTLCVYEDLIKEFHCYTEALKQTNLDLIAFITEEKACNAKLVDTLLMKEKHEMMQNTEVSKLKDENINLKNQLSVQCEKHGYEICNLKENLSIEISLKEKYLSKNLSLVEKTELQSSQNKSLIKDIETLQKFNDEQKHDLTSLGVNFKYTSRKYIDEQVKVCKLNEHIAQLTVELNSQKDSAVKLEAELKDKSSEISQLLSENENVLQKMYKEKTKYEDNLMQFKSECENQRMSNDALKNFLKSISDENCSLKKNSKNFMDEIANLNIKLKTLTESYTFLEKDLFALKDEKEILASRLKQCNQLIKERVLEHEKHTEFLEDISNYFHLLKNDMDQQRNIFMNELIACTRNIAEVQEDCEKFQSLVNNEIGEILKMQLYQDRLYKEKILFLESLQNEVPLEAKQQLEKFQEEKENWKKQFLNLEAKVSPFKKQLDAYELEKNSLLSQNIEKEQELEKLSDKYAKLLGHQNINQKIKHVVKIKEENHNLKKELGSFKEKVTKQQKIITELKVVVSSLGKKSKEENILKVKN